MSKNSQENEEFHDNGDSQEEKEASPSSNFPIQEPQEILVGSDIEDTEEGEGVFENVEDLQNISESTKNTNEKHSPSHKIKLTPIIPEN